jgi:cell division septum initiation protein DivIVA
MGREEERVDQAVDEMRSDVDELEQRHDELEQRAEDARREAERVKEASPATKALAEDDVDGTEADAGEQASPKDG